MGRRVAKLFTPLAEAATYIFRQSVFQLLDPRLRPVDPWLRVIMIQALNGAFLSLFGALKLWFHGDVHPLTQAFQGGLLVDQAQLRILLLRAMEQLGRAVLTTGEEVIHRYLQMLLSGLQLTRQPLLIVADDLRDG